MIGKDSYSFQQNVTRYLNYVCGTRLDQILSWTEKSSHKGEGIAATDDVAAGS